jgi:cell division transport system permease protein
MKSFFATVKNQLKTGMGAVFRKGYVNNVSLLTIALSVFITATFLLFLINVNDMVEDWKKGVRVMVYLDAAVTPDQIHEIEARIQSVAGVQDLTFISKADALAYLKDQLKGQVSLFEDLGENPLPDAFEVRLGSSTMDMDGITATARQFHAISGVESVEYGQVWLSRFLNVFNLFQLVTYGIAGLFFMACVFIIGNTIRLMLYSKREEVEIMRLVGASESFIKKPYYVEGLVIGFLGGILGLLGVYLGFTAVSSTIIQSESTQLLEIRFFPWRMSLGIILCSIFVGWLGCFLSLGQFLKRH